MAAEETKPKKKSATDILAEMELINLLDMARNEQDLANIGAEAGISIGSVGNDIATIFDENVPIHRRIAKGMHAGSTIGAMLMSAYETYRRLRRGK